jgi:hypothetical protein
VSTRGQQPRAVVELPSTERLAGAGSFTPDGRRFAVAAVAGCVERCSADGLNARIWRIRLRDSTTGAVELPETTFPELPGAAVRVAGWQRDGTPVVVRYFDAPGNGVSEDAPTAYRVVRSAELLALPPGGAPVPLVRTPKSEVWDLDVARDLILEGRFGGPSPRPGILPVARWVPGWIGATIVFLLVVGLFVRLVRRRRRRSAPPRRDVWDPGLWEPETTRRRHP